jgi:hypothetical protein
MRASLISFLLFSLPLAALAVDPGDEAPLYDGRWSVRLDAQTAATITLAAWEGTWRWTGRGARANAACRGKPLPITIQHSGSSGLEFTAWGSTISPKCPDIALSLKPVDARSLEGTTDSGSKATIVRASRR